MQRNHWWLVVGSGKALQVPAEAVRTLPVVLVPEIAGLTVAVGVLVIWPVERETLTPLDNMFLAMTFTMTCFPRLVSLNVIERDEIKVAETGTRLSVRPELLPSCP